MISTTVLGQLQASFAAMGAMGFRCGGCAVASEIEAVN